MNEYLRKLAFEMLNIAGYCADRVKPTDPPNAEWAIEFRDFNTLYHRLLEMSKSPEWKDAVSIYHGIED